MGGLGRGCDSRKQETRTGKQKKAKQKIHFWRYFTALQLVFDPGEIFSWGMKGVGIDLLAPVRYTPGFLMAKFKSGFPGREVSLLNPRQGSLSLHLCKTSQGLHGSGCCSFGRRTR